MRRQSQAQDELHARWHVARRSGRAYWGMLLFLLGFVLLLVLVSRAYLMPALSAAGDLGITPQERGHLAAYSTLLLVVVLLILAIGLMMTMRVRRFFVRESRPTQTQYVDAWAEAGRRAKAPEAEDPAEPSH